MAVVMLFPLFLLFVLPVLLSFFLSHYSTKKSKQPKLPPGPPNLPIIGNFHQVGKVPHRSLWQLSQTYGPTILLHLGRIPALVVSSAETAREILQTRDLDCCTRPLLFGHKKISYNYSDIAGAPYGPYWREMRKICVLQLFSTKRMQSFRFIREGEVASMINSISQASLSSSSVVNLTEKLFSLTDTIICNVAFGKSYQGREMDNVRFLDVLQEAMVIIGYFSASDHFPPVGWIFDKIKGFPAKIDRVFYYLDAFFQQIIDEHLDPERSKSEHEDITDVLLGVARDESSAIRPTMEHIKAVLMNLFIGGSESSAVTMEWAMAELINKPRAMKKVQDEIRSWVGRKGKVNESDLVQLKYLKTVVKETLRLHPPAPFLIPRETIRHCKINGYDIYPKTRVLVNVWAIGRDPKYWKNPHEFWPERFEENSSIDFYGQHFQLLPFGAGRRGCPAISMGTTTVELGLANLLCCFDWELPCGIEKKECNMDELAVGIAVHKKISLQLVPTIYKINI